jgi:hypothetical protein
LSLPERNRLLTESIPDLLQPEKRRFALRRTSGGLEWFEAKLTEVVDGEPVFHGYPTDFVPAKVLRVFRDRGLISDAEYRAQIKALG